MSIEEAELKISRAKSTMILDSKLKFFSFIALALKYEAKDWLPTAATDGDKVYYSPDFINKLPKDELLYVICHEVVHIMLEHVPRSRDHDPQVWNIACDYVVNCLLDETAGTGTRPALCLSDHALCHKYDYNVDRIYNHLISTLPPPPPGGGGGAPGELGGKSFDPSQFNGQNGNAMDYVFDPSKTESERQATDAKLRGLVAQAAEAARQAGQMPANLDRLVKDYVHPKMNWREILAEFCTTRVKRDYSYAKTRRRWAASDMKMPSASGDTIGQVMVVVDTSGSISDETLRLFGGATYDVMEQCNPTEVVVVYHDHAVAHHDRFEKLEDFHLAPHGGGGTAFSPVIRWAEEEDIKPDVCIWLTDLYCSDFGPEPDYPVLWITIGTEEAPWGTVIKMGDV